MLPQLSKSIRPVIAIVKLWKLPQCTKDIAELQSAEHAAQKALTCHMFMIVLNNLRFLVRQGLALRGDGDEFNSDFVQLLRLHGLNCGDVDVDSWLAKSTHHQMCRMSVWS